MVVLCLVIKIQQDRIQPWDIDLTFIDIWDIYLGHTLFPLKLCGFLEVVTFVQWT